MIPIVIQNGSGFIWSASDWLKVREESRIVGSLSGCLVGLPRQETLQGLPCVLLDEEVTLLLEKNLAFVINDSILSKSPDEESKEKYLLYKEENRKEQVACYEAQRKQQITSMIDKIIEGKRRKLLGLSTKKRKGQDESSKMEESVQTELELNRDEILKNELSKASCNAVPPLLVQTFTSEHWLNSDEDNRAQWLYPETSHDKLKYSVFKDLWNKGFYITGGHKFGVDYLVYPGDPVKFHAQFLIICMEYNNSISTVDFVAYARLGSISRKTFVIASQPPNSESVLYQSIQWTDKN